MIRSSYLLIVTGYLLIVTPALAQETTGFSNSYEESFYEFNSALTPFKQVEPVSKNLFDGIGEFFSKLLGFLPFFKEVFAARVDIQTQAELPKEVNSQEGDIINRIAEDLGSGDKTGLLNSLIPKEARQGLDQGCQTARMFDQANYPAGINPVSESGCTKQ